jgi:hypothetical protein
MLSRVSVANYSGLAAVRQIDLLLSIISRQKRLPSPTPLFYNSEAERRKTADEEEKRRRLAEYLQSCDKVKQEFQQQKTGSSVVSAKICLKACEDVRNGKPLDVAKREQSILYARQSAR